ASGREVHLADLPPELGNETSRTLLDSNTTDWREHLQKWACNELAMGKDKILEQATPSFERVMIEAALQHTQGGKREAAELLGWGRNTLTRKMKELGM
ncbi:MAG: nitrogen regulation protein NR(I), partial [Halieaceae bacterium]|nr:nitrogen regulation protein NR(I) [Halieaceae bacterium]